MKMKTSKQGLHPIIQNYSRKKIRPAYRVYCVRELAATQIVLGMMAIGFQIWDVTLASNVSSGRVGIWTGLIFVAAGALGIVSCRRRTACSIVLFLTMSVIASTFTLALMIASIIGVTSSYEDKFLQDVYKDKPEYQSIHSHYTKMHAASACLLVISLAEALVAIISSGFACHGLCSGAVTTGNVYLENAVQYGTDLDNLPQMMILPSNQQQQPNVMVYNPVPNAPAYSPNPNVPAYSPNHNVPAYSPNHNVPAYNPNHQEPACSSGVKSSAVPTVPSAPSAPQMTSGYCAPQYVPSQPPVYNWPNQGYPPPQYQEKFSA